jgi:dipeptidyl aminopeptidase/acylaminoacyl peptidase
LSETLPPIPLEDFFRKPDKVQVRVSPGGGFLAWLEPWERRLNLHVRDLRSGETRRVTAAAERDLGGYAWVNDERLVYVQDKGGDENFRLYAVGRDGSNPLDLTPYDGVKCDIVDDLEEIDNEILIQMNRRNPEIFDVYRVDVNSGEMEMIAENPGNVQSWATDHDGRLRLATTTDGLHTSILYRETEANPWREVARYDFREGATPRLFGFDNRSLVVSSNVGRDKSAIFEYDLAAGRETELLFEHPEVDVWEPLWSKARKKLTGFMFETDKWRYHFIDDERARLQQFVDDSLPGQENRVISCSKDERRFVVYSGSDRNVGSYHLVDLDGPRIEKLFDLAPWLDPERLSTVTPVSFPSHDGLTLHGYLTLPRDVDTRPLPLVMLPHGGPWHRDSWGYDPELQFLANRGYAVLQVNFRGSTGYGRRFWEASFGEWGLSMQDDVTSAVRWAIDEGIADPLRVAIYGGSYGGYAALSGLTKTPDLYACGVSYVGVSNLFTWIEAFPPYWKPFLETVYEMVGHPERDEQRFRDNSPFFNADRIKVPLLVAQGANDPRVRKEESDQIVAALEQRGVEVEYLVKENEGHGFSNEENQFEFYRALEGFLERHLN